MKIIGTLDDTLFFPYNSVQNEAGEDDRLYDSQDWADYFKQFIGNGVFPNPSNGLKVESRYGTMVLTVRAGAAFIDGHLYMQKKDFEFVITPSHLTLGRRDTVICRHDAVNRTMQVFYVEGTPASNPGIPPIVRTDDIFDLKLCEITVNASAQAVTQANISDTRLNTAVCGIVHGVVDQVDTSAIFNQYQTFLNEQISSWNTIKNEQQSAWHNQTEQQQSMWQIQTERQQSEWQAQAEQQQSEWQTQTEQQQSIWQIQTQYQQSTWESWFARIGVDIQIFATFNFENVAALPFTEKLTTFPPNKVLEVITISGNSEKVAERELDLSTFVTTEKVYGSGGEIVRQATVTTTFPDGNIKDVITL